MPVTNFVWDDVNDNVLFETDNSDNETAAYIQKPELFGELLCQKRNDVTSYFHYDGENSTSSMTDESEVVTDTYAYTGYGEVVARTGVTTNPFAYKGAVGYYTNPEVGDLYVRARTYQPIIGLWLSKDPLGFVDGPNLYRAYFVPDSTDPDGKRKQGKCHLKADYDFDWCMNVNRSFVCGLTCVNWISDHGRATLPGKGRVRATLHKALKGSRRCSQFAACLACVALYDDACRRQYECNMRYCNGEFGNWGRVLCGGALSFYY